MFFSKYPEFVQRDPRISRSDGYRPTEEFLSARYANLVPESLINNKSVLDIGSCVGSLGAWCLANGASRYTGLEIQRELHQVATECMKQYFKSGPWTLINDDAEAWIDTMPDYDLIVVAGTIQTFRDPVSVLKKLSQRTNSLIIESTHPHLFSEMLTGAYSKPVFTDDELSLIHSLLEDPPYREVFRKILEDKLPILYNKTSTSLFKSENLLPTSVTANATYPSLGFLINLMENIGFAADLQINHRLKTALPETYNWPGRYAVLFDKVNHISIPAFQDYEHK